MSQNTKPTLPDCTVVIPTRDRHAMLERCLRSLGGLELGAHTIEILVSVDGPDTGEQALVDRLSVPARVIQGHPSDPTGSAGPGAARNRAIDEAKGDLLLLLNDDVAAAPGLITAHVKAHVARKPASPAMVLGASPWVMHDPDRLFDRLIRETSMVFFYDQMNGEDPAHDWGFRHAWTLNLSVPTHAALEVGGFCDSLPAAAFEDLEWAWRVAGKFAAPVLFEPAAVVTHEHRYEPAGYLQREHRLGRDAWALAAANPACGRDLFGRDLRTNAEIEYSLAFVERERSAAERLEKEFLSLADLPASAVGSGEILKLVYSQHLLLKRWHWRQGLLEAASMDPEFASVVGPPIHAA